MMFPFDRPIVCPVLVGRESILASLQHFVADARAGAGQTVLVAGEAGIGKSRLVAEATACAARRGVDVLKGRCFEPDRSLPYAPLLDLLYSWLAPLPPAEIARYLGPDAPDLVTLLPDLAAWLPEVAPRPALDPDHEQRRRFQALAHVFTQLAATRPLVLVVEDVHWSDDTSLEFLRYLARRITSRPLLLLLTYRSDEVGESLAHLLAELDRERLAAEVRLSPLTTTETAAMVHAILAPDRPVAPALLRVISTLTEGNPFFVEEVLRSLIAAGDLPEGGGAEEGPPLDELRIPRSVEEAVRRRAARLSDAARHTLRLAAVAGLRFDFALLSALTQADEHELLDQIKELIATQLVVEESAERFAFRHALTRQAVYAGLLARERRTLHGQIAEAIEHLHAEAIEPHLADLAHHCHEAGEWTKALDYSSRAGEQALGVYAPSAAVDHLTRALDSVRRLGQQPSARLHVARGQAYETLGDFERAREDYETGLAVAQTAADRPTAWQALLALGMLWAGRDYARAGDYLRRALELAREIGDRVAVGHSLNRVGNWRMNVDDPFAARKYHQEALAIFEALDDRDGIAATLDLLGMASLFGDDILQSTAYYERAVALGGELDARQGLVHGLAMMANNLYAPTAVVPATSFTERARDAEMAARIAREIGWRAGEVHTQFSLAQCYAAWGRYSRALACAQTALAIAEDIAHRQWTAIGHTTLGVLSLELLALPAAQWHLEQALALAGEIGSRFLVHIASEFLASALVARGDLTGAAAVLDAVLGPDRPAETLAQRRVWYARAELALACGDPEHALRIVDRLFASAANIEGRGWDSLPYLARFRGLALGALQRPVDAEAALRAARAGAVARDAQPLLWRIHVALGDLSKTQGRQDDATQEYAAARAIVDELATDVPDEALRQSFLAGATALLPRPHPLSRLQTAKQESGGLTRREREVAALVAQGKSNRAIAEALCVGERTIAGHVGNILAKLRFTSRAQIAVYAQERGLSKSG